VPGDDRTDDVEAMMDAQVIQRAEQRGSDVALAAQRLGCRGGTGADESAYAELARLWDAAFEAGRIAALDEFQDRFCVCMK
jgi:hypothetical protein